MYILACSKISTIHYKHKSKLYASNISATQKAEPFIGGLPDHTKMDVELHAPQDLKMAMYHVRAFKRRVAAMPSTAAPRSAGLHYVPVFPLRPGWRRLLHSPGWVAR